MRWLCVACLCDWLVACFVCVVVCECVWLRACLIVRVCACMVAVLCANISDGSLVCVVVSVVCLMVCLFGD